VICFLFFRYIPIKQHDLFLKEQLQAGHGGTPRIPALGRLRWKERMVSSKASLGYKMRPCHRKKKKKRKEKKP
jgi:hypothetical protein